MNMETTKTNNSDNLRTVTVFYGYGFIGLDIVCGTKPVFCRSYKTWRPIIKTIASFERQGIPYVIRVRELGGVS